ncbi:MAG: TonB-dependent receptor domain-containing protein [Pyrinomonadaceae bacterium]
MRRLTTRLVSSTSLSLLFIASANFAAALGFNAPRDSGATLSSRAPAQDLDDVTISGRVVDENGAVVVGAKVSATLAGVGVRRECASDGEGRYRLVELPPGAWALKVSAEGFASEERAGLNTVAGQNVKLDFTLRVAGVEGSQTVTAEVDAPAVDTARTVAGGTVTRREIERLPVSTRSPLDLVFTLPGVAEEPLSVRDAAEDRDGGSRSAARSAQTPEEAGTFALSGGAAYSNNLTIDGLDNNDDRSARERFQPSVEAVEEVQIITNQFSAEYGRASGGRVNLRTRAGTNDFHGRAFDFFRDEGLNANTFFNNLRGLKRLPLQEHDPGFTLGGRIVPRRTFFFAAYEYDTLLDSNVIDTLVPVQTNPGFPLPQPTTLAGRRTEHVSNSSSVAAELAPFVAPVSTPQRSHTLTSRLDHSFTETHNGAWLFQLGRLRNLRQFGGGSRLASALQGRTRDSDALAYTDNFVFSARAVNQLRAQASRLSPSLKTNADGARPVVLITINDPLSGDDAADRSGTLVAGSSSAGASDRRESRFQVQDAFALLRGAHTLKFGGDFQRIRTTFVDLTDASGTFSFSSAGDFLSNAPSRFRQRFQTRSRQRNTYTGFFAQDEWRVRPNLLLSFGLRHDDETIIRDRNNFAPRLAAAYDPTGKGKTVIRLGAGVFFNRALLRTVDDFTLGQNRLVFDTNDLRDAATGRAMTDAQRRAFVAANLNFPNTLTADSPLVREFASPETDFTRRLDPALRIPASYQTNVGFERELARGFVVEANYTFNRGLHLWREFNANAPRLPRGYKDFADYLLSRDFPNLRDAAGTRPLYDAQTAGDLVRFTLAPSATSNPDAITRVVEFGVPVTLFNLNSVSSTTALDAALAALANLRPDPSRTQVEQLVSAGDSFYHGLTVEARERFSSRASGYGLSLRAAYTLSRLVDDGVVNTSSALRVGDFRGERARSLLDRRHRFVASGTFDLPRRSGGLRLATIMRVASGAPFNVSLGGDDRNLDDVGNDRPVFTGDLRLIRWHAPGTSADPALLAAFALPAIGRTGNLPRNAGQGPGLFTFALNVEREFRVAGRARLRPVVEVDNVLNKTVFTYGAEFINFSALRPDAAPAQRQALLDSFLAPTRTLRPRTVRVGVRFDF